tara:strand:+ start:3956 stop:4303 length:348 start_codon:yes stop_codon:yes gene_type:complete
MKVSFDFDSTLTRDDIQALAKRHIHFGDEVHITTTRRNNVSGFKIENEDLFKIASELKIDEDNIHFTNYEDKVDYLTDFDMHYDDDEYEIDLITRSKIKCLGILINYKNYYVDNQ